jgi:hypothetical protein
MKKVFIFSLALGVILAGFAFGADGYIVQNLTGKVERQGTSGQWIAVSAGDTLSPATTVKIGINSSLVVKSGEKETTIRSARQGTLESLLSAGTGAAKITVGGNVANSDIPAAALGASNISTSSTRASSAADDLEWVEE